MKRFLPLMMTLIGCGGGGSGLPVPADVNEIVITTDVVDVVHDVSVDLPAPWDTSVDIAPPDVAPDVATDAPDVSGDLGQPDIPINCPGELMCPCQDGTECFSGFCVETMDGKRCSKPCALGDDSCPIGWRCSASSGGADPTTICLAPATQCRPCRTDEDCALAPWGPNICVSRGGEGAFCGVSCSDESPCMAGFECVAVTDGEKNEDVCRPIGGAACPCTSWFVDQHFTTECYTTADPSVCRGERTCDAACEPVAAAEACDGLDNDCDGATDNGCDKDSDGYCSSGLAITGPPWPAVCPKGGEDCNDAVAAINPGASEACNGKDDDCDGRTDNKAGSTEPISSQTASDGTCSNKGVCAAGVPRDCVAGQWQCDYSGVFLYQSPETGCDNLDNSCDGCTDEGLGADSREPGNNMYNASNVVYPGSTGDCDGASTIEVPSMTIHRNASGCTADVDWYQFDYVDKKTCVDNAITVAFTSNPMNYGLCAYFKCKDGKLEKFTCHEGTVVTDGPRDVDPGGYGCCCTGGNCKAMLDSSTTWGGPACDDSSNDDGKIYVKVFTTGATSCSATYSFSVWGN